MATMTRYPQDVRERAIRMVFDQQGQYASQWEALRSISSKIGCSIPILRSWVHQAEIDSGQRDVLARRRQAKLEALEKEVRELRRAKEILNQTFASFDPAEVDRRSR